MRIVRALTALTLIAAPVFGAVATDPANAWLPPIDPTPIVLPPLLPSPYMCNGLVATIVGTPDDDILVGTNGDDVIVALAGWDQIWGHGGRDTICAGSGDDLIAGEAGRDYIDGQSGHDLIGYGVDPAPISASLMLNRVVSAEGTDTVLRVESVYGSPFDDRIVGNRFDNLLYGAGGVDSIDGRAGFDGCGGETVARCEYEVSFPLL